MSRNPSIRLALLPVVLVWCLLSPYPTHGADVANHRQIQEALDASPAPTGGKILSVGSWVDDVFVLPYSIQDPFECFVGGNLNVGPRKWIAQSFLEDNPDDYDFLLVLTRFEFGGEDGVSGFYWEIRNDVEGIGIPQFDISQEFGSARLQGFIDGGSLSQYVLEDGSIDTDRVEIVLNHELAHRWSGRCRFIDNGGDISTALLGLNGAHWSYLLDSDASYLYGSDWTDNHDGTYTATGVLSAFSDLDLYLMGLMDPSDIGLLRLLENPSVPSEALPGLGDVVSATPRPITVDQIIAAEGLRIPGFSDSPKEHRIAVIYLVEPGAEIDQAELRSIDEIRSLWRRSFFRETGGRAVVDVAMAGAPPISTPDFDLQAARIWLETNASGGLWQDSPTTVVRDTSEALTALARFASAATTVDEGVEALGRVQATSIELAARQAEALALAGDSDLATALVGDLADHHGQTGAWGSFDRYSPDIVSAAVALRSLASVAVEDPLKVETWSWIASQQNPDGGWAWRPGGPSAVYPTLEALLAGVQTRVIDQNSPVLMAATNWLLPQQRGDGGFGDSSSGIVETALFLRTCGGLPIDQASINDAIVFLAQRQEANGSWQGRTLKTAVAITALAPYFMADPWVSAEEIIVTPAAPFVGDDLALQGAIRNGGGTLPAGTEYRWDLLDASQPGVVWASFSGFLPEIAGGGWAVVQDSWDPGVPAGSYLLRLVVDPQSLIDDADPSNNSATLPLEVRAHPEGVDLAFSGIPMSDPGSVSHVPQPVIVSGVVENLGMSSTPNFAISVFDGDPDLDILLASQMVSIAALDSAPFAIPVILSEPKAYSLTVVLDPNDLSLDEDRSNNAAPLDLSITSTFDPGVVPGTFAVAPVEVGVGDLVTLSATVGNTGTEEIGGIQIAFSYESGSPPITTPIVLQEIIEPIRPGETRDIHVAWRPAVSGSPVVVRSEVDPQLLIQDVDRTNNSAVTSVVVNPSDLPNLRVSPESLTFDPTQPHQGASVDLIGEISNNGTNPSGPFTAVIRLDDATSGAIIASSVVGGLDPGGSATVAGTWTVDEPDDRLVYLTVDTGDEVEEFNELDNQAFQVMDVRSLPDLVLSSGSVVATPSFPHSGEDVQFAVTIDNTGDQPAGATTVELLDDLGNVLGSAPLASVPAHGQGSVAIDWQASDSQGEVTLVFSVNASQTVVEQDFDNNEVRLTLAVQDGDFFLSSPYCSPNGDGIQESVVLYFRHDAGVVTIFDGNGGIVRTVSVTAGEHSIEWNGRDESGLVVPDGIYTLECDPESIAVTVDTNRIPLTDDLSGPLLTTTLMSTPDRSFGFGSMVLSPADGAAFFYQAGEGLVKFGWGEVREMGFWGGDLISVNFDESLFAFGGHCNSDGYCTDGKIVRLPEMIWEERPDLARSPAFSPNGDWHTRIIHEGGFDSQLETILLTWVDDPTVSFELNPVDLYPDLVGSCLSEPVWSLDGKTAFVMAEVTEDEDMDPESLDHFYYLIAPQEPPEPPSVRVVYPDIWPESLDCGFFKNWRKGVAFGDWAGWLSVDFLKDSLFILHEDSFGAFDGFVVSTYRLGSGEYQSAAETSPDEVLPLSLSNNGRAALLDSGEWGEPHDYALKNWQTGEQKDIPAPTDPDAKPIWSPLDKYLYFPGEDSLDVVGTAGNLTVDLKPHILFGNAGISLSIVATDRHFDQFRIAYAPEDSPGTFFGLGSPSREPMFGESWGTWLPPAKGGYLLRLDGSDLAGNHRSVTKRVFWDGDNDIANLALESRYVSPVSSPGIKDTLGFRYVVLRPANLVFEIKDDQDRTVRTIPVAADELGLRSTLWDGTNEGGIPVSDGRYTLNYLGAQWPFIIDNTPPEISLEIGSRKLRPAPDTPNNAWIVSLEGEVRDENSDQWFFQSRPAATQEGWIMRSQGIGNLPPEAFPFPTVAAEFFNEEDLRLVATDYAGNTSEAFRAHRDEFIDFAASEPLCTTSNTVRARCSVQDRPPIDAVSDQGAPLIGTSGRSLILYPDYTALVIQSTVWCDLSNDLRLEYRALGIGGLPGGAWETGSVEVAGGPIPRSITYSESMIVDGETIDVLRDVTAQLTALYWNHSDLPVGAYEVRLIAANDDGQDVFSPTIPIHPATPLVLELQEMNDDGRHYRVTNVSEETLSDIALQVHSRFSTAPWLGLQQVVVSLEPGQYAEGTLGCELFVLPENPELRATARSGEVLSNLVEPDTSPRRVTLKPVFQPADCLHDHPDSVGIATGDSSVFPLGGGPVYSAGGTAQLQISVPEDPAGTPLTAFELTIDGMTAARLNDPASTTSMALLYLSNLSDGAHTIAERFDYPTGRQGLLGQCARSWNLTIDRAPPEVEILAPVDEATLCPANGIVTVAINAGDTMDVALEVGLVVDGVEFGNSLQIDTSTLAPGRHDLAVRVRDDGGLSACDTIGFYIGEQPGNTGLTAAPFLFSPTNTTGAPTTTDLSFNAHVPVTFSSEIRSLQSGEVVNATSGQADRDETVVRTWDGHDTLGAPLPDGLFSVTVRLENSCGATSVATIPDQTHGHNNPIEIDTTPPIVQISEPVPGTEVGAAVEVKALVEDINLLDWNIEVRSIDDCDECWVSVAAGINQTTDDDDLLGVWETAGFEAGQFLIRVSAMDRAGNLTDPGPIQISLRDQALIERFSANPPLVSPGGDGILDWEDIEFSLVQDAVVTLRILDDQNTVVRTFNDSEILAGGPGSWFGLVWDGVDDAGVAVASGSYTIVLQADDPAQPPVIPSETESLTVVVDMTPPDVEFHQPADAALVGLPVEIVATVDDPNPGDYVLTLSGPAGFHQVLKSGTGNIDSSQMALLSGISDGPYEAWLRSTDRAGNTAEIGLHLTIDSTVPSVTMLSPLAGAALKTTEGRIHLRAQIEEDHLTDFRWSVGPGEDPQDGDFVEIGWGSSIPAGGVVEELWDAAALSDGPVTLRLRATDEMGLIGEARRLIVIDNTAPDVELTAPSDGAKLWAPTTIEGRISDSTLARWELHSIRADGTSALLAHGIQAQAGPMASWDPLPQDGVYELVLDAEDRAGNRAESHVAVSIITEIPSAPIDLTAVLVNGHDAVLSWSPGPGIVPSRYSVYRDGTFRVSVSGTTTWTDFGLDEGAYVYTVRAVNAAGWGSPHSNPASVTVNLTPPLAHISEPRALARVNGDLDVFGTAFRDTDFKEFQLTIRATPDGTPLLLTRSTTPVLADLLGHWSPLSLGAADGPYELRLVAFDIFGNTASETVTVTLDTAPPQAPSLIDATLGAQDPDGIVNDVHIVWQFDAPPPDHAGYYLYRNGRLANAPGIIVGHQNAYLLTGLSFDDLNVPDGQYVYTVTAADLAGNESSDSNPSPEIVIDTRRPHAIISSPQDGSEIGSSIEVVATTPDEDITSLVFQYQAQGDPTWTPFGAIQVAPPFAATFEPPSIGAFSLRAVASDASGDDPAPEFINVIATIPPPRPSVSVDEGTVTLSWAPLGDPLLAHGFNVYRDGNLMTPAPLPPDASAFVDAGLADGDFAFTLTVIDRMDHETGPSEEAIARVYTVSIDHTSPIVPEGLKTLAGGGAQEGDHIELQRKNPSGVFESEGTVDVQSAKFVIHTIELDPGINTFRVQAIGQEGNRSKASQELTLIFPPTPERSTDVSTSVNGADVTLTWTPASNPDPAGFDLTRDDLEIGESVSAFPFDPVMHELAASGDTVAEWTRAVDGDQQTGWVVLPLPSEETPAFWRWTWPDPVEGTTLAVTWSNGVTDLGFELDLRINDVWLWWASMRSSSTSFDWNLPPGLAVSGIRLRMEHPSQCGGSGHCSPELQEVVFNTINRTMAPNYVDLNVASGPHTYGVAELNTWGLASGVVTEQALVTMAPPSPPLNLAATTGPGCEEITLSWDPPDPAPDFVLGFTIYRAQFPGGPYRWISTASASATAWVDEELVAGEDSSYVVTTVAMISGERVESSPSNEATAIADCSNGFFPVITSPTVAGNPIVLPQGRTTISGSAHSGAGLRLVHNGDEIAETQAGQAERGVLSAYLDGRSDDDGALALTRDGHRVAFSTTVGAFSGIVVLNLDTGEKTTIRHSWEDLIRPALSPDGSMIAFVAGGQWDREIILRDLSTGEERHMTPISGQKSRPVFSPGGERLAFFGLSENMDRLTLLVIDIATGTTSDLRAVVRATTSPPIFSPDGASILVADESWDGSLRLRLANAKTGGYRILNLGEDVFLSGLPFSPDGESLVFARITGNGGFPEATLWKYRFSDHSTEQISQETGEFNPVFLDDRTMAYLARIAPGVFQLRTRDRENAVEILADYLAQDDLPDLITNPSFVMSSGDGWVALGRLQRADLFIRRDGRFVFSDVPLHPGLNTFAARQVDIDPPLESAPIEITVPTEAFPDGEAVGLEAFPPLLLLGEQTIIRGTVENRGGAEIEDCRVTLRRVHDDGSSEVVADRLMTLDPGDTDLLDFRWEGSTTPGDARWLLEVDPDGLIAENDESNNAADLIVPVREVHGLEASVMTDRGVYSPGAVVLIDVALLATGTPRDYELRTNVEDAFGGEVAVIDTRTLEDFGPSTDAFTLTWPLPDIVEGAYRVRLTATGPDGPAAEATADFEVTAPGYLIARVATDSSRYALGDTVSVCGALTNPAAVSRSNLTATFTIENVTGTVVATHSQSLAAIPAGGTISVPWPWRAEGVPTGVYSVGLAVTDPSGTEIARSDPFAFILGDGPPALSGSVTVSPIRLEPFGAVSATAEIGNAGPTAVIALPVTLALVEPGSWAVLAASDGVVDVPPGGSTSFTAPLSVDGLDLGQYLVMLLSGPGGSQQLASVALTLADLTPPDLELIPPAATCGEATFAVHARDALTGVLEVYYTADGEAQPYPMFIQPEIEGGDVYAATWTFSPEQAGAHQIVVGARDRAENRSPGLTFSLTAIIDETPPSIIIGGLPPTDCGNQPVTPVIDVTDANLADVVITLNGETFVSGTTIVDEGNYTLVVVARDTCGAETVGTADFAIDTGPPVVEIKGVGNGECLLGPVTIDFTATDANLADIGATLDGLPFIAGSVVETEGLHTLIVTASDSCGNAISETVIFTLDNELPVITIEGVEDGVCTNEVVTIDFEASDDHLASISATLNGEVYPTGTPITDEGIYTLIVTALEDCGRETTETRSFVIDLAPPVVIITGIPVESCSNQPVTPEITATDTNLTGVVVTLNGETFVPGTTIVDEGNYTLVVVAGDACGNETVETAVFAIDTGPPVIGVSGVADGECIIGPVAIDFTATDANLADVTATLDGLPFVTGQAVDAEGFHTLIVTASDSCGNEISETLTFTLDNALPVITIEGVEDGLCTAEAVTIDFDASDDHLAGVSATLNGEAYATGTQIDDEGTYTLVITAVEECGRETDEDLRFVIDRTQPEITVTGAEDGQTYPDAVTLDWSATDLNDYTLEALLDGAAVTPPVTVDQPGDHTLEVSAIDCADNEAYTTVAFTVGLQGPPPLLGDLTVAPDIVERGRPIGFAAQITNDGDQPVDDILVTFAVIPDAGSTPVAEITSALSLGPDESRTVEEILTTRNLQPGIYRVELRASGVFFGEDYDLDLDTAAFEVLQVAAIPGLDPAGMLILILLTACAGFAILRRSR
jgi:flagellar hook assembly protein FlgD/Tol biopolymer transport system component